MGITIRAIQAEEVEAFQDVMGIAFGFDPSPQMLAEFTEVFELARLRSAFDGDQLIATFGAFSFKMAVPGGKLPTAGTTVVTVLATHRRQGILKSLLTDHFAELHQGGEPLAALWASESSIYGRFGYGPATRRVTARLPKPFARMSHPVDISGTMRLVDLNEALAHFPRVYQGVTPRRPGMLDRTEAWWKYRVFRDLEERRDGATKHRRVLYTRGGQPSGYATYRTRHHDDSNVVRVVELIGVDAEAEKAVWQYLFGIDLTTSIEYWNHPVDSPLHWWLEQPRRLERKIEDQLWVRVVDVCRALEGRRYSQAGRLTFRLHDPVCPWNEGVYRLETDSAGQAQCALTDDQPAIELDAQALGTVYLGGIRFRSLARAGFMRGTPAALQLADNMFGWDPLPWCPELF